MVIRPPPMAARALPSTAKRAGESSLDAACCQFTSQLGRSMEDIPKTPVTTVEAMSGPAVAMKYAPLRIGSTPLMV